ncbi:hypothetical protein B5X24_HaOG206759 [Helicoverpa armigera]|uniref:Uncharacterized protein n=1 Tax=Helicoverpa armigera TaxID=29058 RepID=A0A2W1BQB7_HELAM|nr:hypothetical protein B5X24_HaOG206759 [Helicoverpa armigera]
MPCVDCNILWVGTLHVTKGSNATTPRRLDEASTKTELRLSSADATLTATTLPSEFTKEIEKKNFKWPQLGL